MSEPVSARRTRWFDLMTYFTYIRSIHVMSRVVFLLREHWENISSFTVSSRHAKPSLSNTSSGDWILTHASLASIP